MADGKYRVFLSSVQKELETERVAVAGSVSSDTVLSHYAEIVLFEKEPLSGRKVAKPYLDCLDTCDIYVLILDREYGNVQDTLSATHEEYRYAQYNRMPVMIFVRGHHDTGREEKTQDFFQEIKKEGHTYRRFHDRVDLLPEIKHGLTRVLREIYGLDIEEDLRTQASEIANASSFELQLLEVPVSSLELDVAREWLLALGALSMNKRITRSSLLNALREKGLVRKNDQGDGYRAMASGLLFLGKNPGQFFSQCRILADAYDGVELDPRPKDQDTISRPAARMVETVVNFVMKNTRHPIRVSGIHRVKIDEYPPEVIREAIVNAIAHRDYEDAARTIYVKVFYDRVEILSPGNLMRPLTISKLRRGNYEPSSRNPTLAQYLSQMNLMEQRGSGIRRMHAAMVDHGLDVPEYSFRNGYFKVTLRGPGDNLECLKTPAKQTILPSVEERLTERQCQMAELLADGKGLTSRDCQERFGISGVTAAADFKILVDLGIAERIGKGRSTRYVFQSGGR